jgi:hypothetical protein
MDVFVQIVLRNYRFLCKLLFSVDVCAPLCWDTRFACMLVHSSKSAVLRETAQLSHQCEAAVPLSMRILMSVRHCWDTRFACMLVHSSKSAVLRETAQLSHQCEAAVPLSMRILREIAQSFHYRSMSMHILRETAQLSHHCEAVVGISMHILREIAQSSTFCETRSSCERVGVT